MPDDNPREASANVSGRTCSKRDGTKVTAGEKITLRSSHKLHGLSKPIGFGITRCVDVRVPSPPKWPNQS